MKPDEQQGAEPPTRPETSGRVPGLFFSAEARERQRGRALAGASRVAKGMRRGGSKCPKQSSALTQASIKKGRFLLQLFFLKEKLRTGFRNIIQKPHAMNRPAMKLTSLTDGGAGRWPTHCRPMIFGTANFFNAPDQRTGARVVGARRSKKRHADYRHGYLINTHLVIFV